jgi:RHS repeat-associated protein
VEFRATAGGAITRWANYTYDAFDRRLSKTVDPDGAGTNPAIVQRFVYDRDHIWLCFNDTNNVTHRYLYGPAVDMVLVEERSATTVLWPLADNQGTIRDITNNVGAIQNHVTYNSFGRFITQTNPNVSTRFNYTGREFDGEAGLYYYRSRYYDPVVGRFIGEDAIGFDAEDFNLYRYVGNSPTNFTDPMGTNAAALAIPVAGGLIILGIAGIIILTNPEAQKAAAELLRRGIRSIPIDQLDPIPLRIPMPWWFPSKTARESDNRIAKKCRELAGRTGNPCDFWEDLIDEVRKALKSTRNKQEIKMLKASLQEHIKAGKQLGCKNENKRDNEKRGDYGNIK